MIHIKYYIISYHVTRLRLFFCFQVRDIVEECTCPTQFPMIHVAEGKYRIGDTKVTIYVRVLRSHVMVRVGGGWDTLSHYLEKHDPCRCRNCEYRTCFIRFFLFNELYLNEPNLLLYDLIFLLFF